MLISVALGQVLSLLICGISLTSKYLSEDFHANTPVFQSFLNYILLFLVYTTTLAVRQGKHAKPISLLPVSSRVMSYDQINFFHLQHHKTIQTPNLTVLFCDNVANKMNE